MNKMPQRIGTFIALAALANVHCALASTKADADGTARGRAEAAYAAVNAVRSAGAAEPLTSVVIKGSVKHWDPGGSHSVTDPLEPDLGTSTFIDTWDRARDLWRTDWVRPKFVSGTRTYTEVYSRSGGYVTGMDVNYGLPRRTLQTDGGVPVHTMSAVRLRALLREQARNHVVLLMHEHPDRISWLPDQQFGGKSYPAVQYRDDNGTFVVLFDTATNLPAVVRTRDFDAHMGDADYDAVYSDWRSVGVGGRFKYPFRIAYTLNGVKVADLTVDQVTLDENVPADAFEAPAALKGQAKGPAAAEATPFQWVLRRLASGFYLDADALHMDDGSTLALTDVGPNISMVTGGSHNVLIVATNDSLVLFDAPGDDGLSNWIIEAAQRRYPGKPIRYVVLTHHHLDHTGGIRAFAAKGAALVVGKGDGDYFRKVLTAPQTLNRFGAVAPPPRVIEVKRKWRRTIGGRVIEAYPLENPHAEAYLIPYVPDAKMAFESDLWLTGMRVPSDPALAAFVHRSGRAIVHGLTKAGITPEKLADAHGGVGDYADLVKYVE